MYRLLCGFLFLITLTIQTTWATQAAADERDVKIATLEFQPYVSEQLPGNGWAWEVCATVLENMGYRPKLQIYPWARAVALVKSGKSDALYLANINEDRRKWAVLQRSCRRRNKCCFQTQGYRG